MSQAANIIEAVYAGSKLLLIDEDKSATNFMIRDKIMRKIVKNEPIVPLTDRIDELTKKMHVAVIMVIVSISEYFRYADKILLLEGYVLHGISGNISDNIEKSFADGSINYKCYTHCEYNYQWTQKKKN